MLTAYLSPGVAYLYENSAGFLETASLYLLLQAIDKIQLAPQSTYPFHYIISNHSAVVTLVLLHVLKNIVKAVWGKYQRHQDICRLSAQPIPGLKGGRLPGNIDILYRLVANWRTDYPGGNFVGLKQQNGDLFILDMLWGETLWTDNPHYVKEILTNQFPNFIKGTSFKGSFDSVLGVGIFNSDGDTWKFHRTMTRPFFTRDRVTDFDIFDHHAEVILGKIKGRCDAGLPVDFQEAISQFTMESATEFLFGRSFGALSPPLMLPGGKPPSSSTSSERDVNQFTKAFSSAMECIAMRNRVVGPWQLREIFGDGTRGDMKIICDVLDPIIDAALSSAAKVEVLQSVDELEEERETLLSHLVSETK
ncbi:hypothetical protein FRB98_005159, partial [Tulasnella sp. 332]